MEGKSPIHYACSLDAEILARKNHKVYKLPKEEAQSLINEYKELKVIFCLANI